jgi:phenylacetate-coenzyme A ligase PaaK-like adenylate-forming protein
VITDRLVQTPRRSDAMVKIKGMLVHPQALLVALDQSLGATPYLLSVQAVDPQRPLSGDRLLLQVEGAPDQARGAQLAEQVKAACGVTPDVQFAEPGALAPTGGSWKVKKFIDQRPAH